MVEGALAVLVAASWVYWLVACWMVRSFYRRPRAGRKAPLADAGPPFTPPVSILKPVRGLDAGAYENFSSFCRQDYPHYEIVFGVAEASDPAVPLVRRLQREHPGRSIKLVVARPFAANRKVCLLHQTATVARYDILVMSDSDMRVTPDYLSRVVAPLADPKVGLVTCAYVGTEALSLSARLAALHMGVTFLPSVIVGRRLLAIALGASIVLRRSDLQRLGGFGAFGDFLAEDFQLGAQMAKLGLRVHLSDYVMIDVLGATTLVEEWQREVRWARCTRVSRPREYPGLLLSFSAPLAGALVLLKGLAPPYEQVLAATLILRWVVGWFVTGYTGDREGRRCLPWLPVRDLLSALVWLAAGVGRHVVWRGEDYVLEARGKMRPLALAVADEVPFGEVALGEGGGLDGDAVEGGGEGAGRPPSSLLPHP